MNKKIKILYVSHSSHFNGAEICLLTLVKNINRKLIEPIVVFPYKGPLVECIQDLGIKTYISNLERWIVYEFDRPIKGNDLENRCLKIVDIIEKECIDLIHTNTSVIVEGAIAAKMKNIPHIWHVHEYLEGHSELKTILPLPIVYEAITLLSEAIVCVSDFVKNQFKRYTGEEKVITIYNGVEENIVIRNKGYNEILTGICVGLLSEAKGYDNFLNTASILQKKGYKLKLYWIGGAFKKELRVFRSKVKKLGLKDYVFYKSFTHDIQYILKESDFLICPSTMETLSLVILEAMAAELPVITTACGGTSECVINGTTGFIVPVNDPISMSEKIIKLISDKSKRMEFGYHGLQRYLQKFTAKKFAENFEHLYANVINEYIPKEPTVKENLLLNSFLQIYKDISQLYWKRL